MLEIVKVRVNDGFAQRDVVGLVLDEFADGRKRIAVLPVIEAALLDTPTVLVAASDDRTEVAGLTERVRQLEHRAARPAKGTGRKSSTTA